MIPNDSLVMMTRYNESRAEGDNLPIALKKAGVGRFQAIFLTTVTTVAGLTPLLLETTKCQKCVQKSDHEVLTQFKNSGFGEVTIGLNLAFENF